jgi:Trehalose and maltose hydrolases (possible phosphorylases)
MKLKFDSVKRAWNIGTPEMLARHDLVFRAPVCDSTYGIPLGNGDSGCLLWLSEDSLNINFNKTDLWDDSKPADGEYCVTEDENAGVCRNGALVKFKFGCPVFGTIYQRKFEARLSLADAAAAIDADTPFCKTKIKAICSERFSVTAVSADIEFGEDMAFELSAERWGSRSFKYWYSAFNPDTAVGLDGTSSSIDYGCMNITQVLNGTVFSVAVLPVCDGIGFSRNSSHEVSCGFTPRRRCSFTVYIAVSTGNDKNDAENKSRGLVLTAARAGMDAIYKRHAEDWGNFWTKSFISLNGDDYLENLWYLNLYYANSEMKGKYPPHFCNGLWGFYHDFVPWNHYFHYNMQLSTFPLGTAGHTELLDTYLNFRFGQLTNAKRFAREIKGADGAFYSDVCDRLGRFDVGSRENCTCASQIALGMYDYYLYTGDSAFLTEKALPVMFAAGEYYLSKLRVGEDSFYHIKNTQGYEGSPLLDDSITDLAMVRALFTALCEVLPNEESRKYSEILTSLVPFETSDFTSDEVSEGVFTRGIGKGKKINGDKVLSVGIKKDNFERLRKTYGNPERDYYGFPDTEMSPVFPAGLVGCNQKDTDLYKQIYNSVCLHHPAIPGGDDGMCMGWCMMPIYLARMGMAKELKTQLYQIVSAWIGYPQGFGIEGPYDVFHGDATLRWKKNKIRNIGTGEISVNPAWNFRHFSYEALPIISTAINEMLVQSHCGLVRLFCAVKREAVLCFKLYARGGFVINAAYDGADEKNIKFDVYIESTQGGILEIAFDNINFEPKFFDIDDKKWFNPQKSGEIYRVETRVGDFIRVCSENAVETGVGCECDLSPNADVKKLGDSMLGCEKEF